MCASESCNRNIDELSVIDRVHMAIDSQALRGPLPLSSVIHKPIHELLELGGWDWSFSIGELAAKVVKLQLSTFNQCTAEAKEDATKADSLVPSASSGSSRGVPSVKWGKTNMQRLRGGFVGYQFARANAIAVLAMDSGKRMMVKIPYRMGTNKLKTLFYVCIRHLDLHLSIWLFITGKYRQGGGGIVIVRQAEAKS